MGRNLDTKNTEISLLNSQLRDLSFELSAERETSRNLTDRLNIQTQEAQKLSDELTGVKDEQAKALAQIALLEQDVKALNLRRQELEKETAAKSKELKSERKISQEAKAHLALLNAQTEKLTKELSRLGNLLDQADKKDKEQKAQIADLGKKLNRALAAKASELASYRSEFFGTLRKVLQDRDDIRIEGDRFVFQSELFFKSGSAFLEDKGKNNWTFWQKRSRNCSAKSRRKFRGCCVLTATRTTYRFITNCIRRTGSCRRIARLPSSSI